MTGDYTGRPAICSVICHIFKIEPVKMRKPAVPAPHRDVAAADGEVVKPGDTAVPARGFHSKGPDRPRPGSGKGPGFVNILNSGHKDPGCAACFAGDVGPVRHCMDMLVCHFPAVIAVGAVGSADEPVTHEGYVCIRGIINLSQWEKIPADRYPGRSPDYAAVAPHAPQFGGCFWICTGFCHKKGKFI